VSYQEIPIDGSGNVPVDIQNLVAVTGPLTDAELRATPVPVSGTVVVSSATIIAVTDVVDAGNSSTATLLAGATFTTIRLT